MDSSKSSPDRIVNDRSATLNLVDLCGEEMAENGQAKSPVGSALNSDERAVSETVPASIDIFGKGTWSNIEKMEVGYGAGFVTSLRLYDSALAREPFGPLSKAASASVRAGVMSTLVFAADQTLDPQSGITGDRSLFRPSIPEEILVGAASTLLNPRFRYAGIATAWLLGRAYNYAVNEESSWHRDKKHN